jgi:hypothetical protein
MWHRNTKNLCLQAKFLARKNPSHPLKIHTEPRDGNLGTGTRPDGYEDGDDFLPVGGTRTRPESRRVRDEYFFPPTGNPTGTRYFTTAIILGYEQVKMCSFCYINYDLFWLLNFAILLSQIFVEY